MLFFSCISSKNFNFISDLVVDSGNIEKLANNKTTFELDKNVLF